MRFTRDLDGLTMGTFYVSILPYSPVFYSYVVRLTDILIKHFIVVI